MKLVIPKGATSRIITVFIQDSSVTTGAGLAGLAETSSIVGGYVREGAAGVALAVDENVTTEGTYQAPSTAAKVRIGTPANMRDGTYELHFHNDLWASGTETVTITLGGAANMAELPIEVQLSDPILGLGAPTALDTLLTRLSATRSTYLDYLFSIYFGLVSAVNHAQGGSAGSITLDATASAVNDFYVGMTVVIYTGTGAGQARSITAYDGGTKVATVLPTWATQPDATSWYVIVTAGAGAAVANIASILADTNELQTDWVNGGRLDLILDARAPAATALSNAVWTDAKAGFIPAGLMPTQAEVLAIQNNTRVRVIIPGAIERPDAGSTTYRLWLYLYDTAGNMEAPDSLPTVTAQNNVGTDRSANLSAVTNPSTGVYYADYTVASDHAIEGLLVEWTTVEGGLTRKHGGGTLVVDTTAVDFTAADRTLLETLHNTRCTEARLAELDAANLPADVDAVLADTNELQTDWVNGGRLDLILDARASENSLTALTLAVGLVSSNVTTIANRIGSWTGTARNTILGAFQALFRSDADATVPSNINTDLGSGVGTADNTTDSQEAIRDLIPAEPAAVGSPMTLADDAITAAKYDESTAFPLSLADTGSNKIARTGADSDTLETLSDQIDGLAALSGEGAFTGALTVNDGATGLEGAVVNARRGGVLIASGTTDANGQITDWVFGAFTYDLAVRLPGYEPTTDTITVSADAWTKTISLTANSITAPPSATTTTGVMTVYDEEGSEEESVEVSIQIIEGPGTDGIGYDSTPWTETSSALGVVQFAGIIKGAQYKIWRGTSKANMQTFTAPTSGDSFDLAEVIGRG